MMMTGPTLPRVLSNIRCAAQVSAMTSAGISRAILPERSGMHDPPRKWAANDAFRKPRGFNQPVKINAGFDAHLVT